MNEPKLVKEYTALRLATPYKDVPKLLSLLQFFR